jgi:hypothetical protein
MMRGRLFIVVLLAGSLACAGGARHWAEATRRAAMTDAFLPTSAAGDSGESGAAGRYEGKGAGLANMDSYALGLLLGGLRGPLVMFLWSTSETQKSAHDLEDFDTKVEWIRLLQPEFDTVHMFQIWNKAYNISVQMANLPTRYSAILDALDYAYSVDRQRPDDINIVFETARLFGDKLGTSHEAYYYIPRVRQETKAPTPLVRVTMPEGMLTQFMDAAHAQGMDEAVGTPEYDEQAETVTVKIEGRFAERLRGSFPGPQVTFVDVARAKPVVGAAVRRDQMDPMLDEKGNILPSLLTPTHPRPANLAADAEWYDGSTLGFLADMGPFPYGLSPQAIAYNYYRRAEMLQDVAHETLLQTAQFVADSRPGLELKFWGEEEGGEGRRAELRFFGQDDSGERAGLENLAPGTNADHPLPPGEPLPAALLRQPNPAAGQRALFSYASAARLYGMSHTELLAHVRRYPRDQDMCQSHIDEDEAMSFLYQGDHDYLAGLIDPSARTAMWASAAENYNHSRQDFVLIILRYYVEDNLAGLYFPKDQSTNAPRTHDTIGQIPAAQQNAILEQIVTATPDYYLHHPNEQGDDRSQNLTYLRRCEARLKLLGR